MALLLKGNGKSLAEIEEAEPEPSLGNGGLGRLAACFLDSIATLGLPGDGVGLNYHLGLFKQVFKDHLQKETPNPWIEKESWLHKTDTTYRIAFGGTTVTSRLYDIDRLQQPRQQASPFRCGVRRRVHRPRRHLL